MFGSQERWYKGNLRCLAVKRDGIRGTLDVWQSREMVHWESQMIGSLERIGILKEPQMIGSLERIGIKGTSDDW